MKKSLFVLYACVAIGMSSCSDSPDLYKDPDRPVDERVDNLMSQMTLEEKVAQMCQYVGLKHMRNSEKHLSLEELEKNHAQGFYKDLHSSQVAEMVEQGWVGSFLHVTDLEEAIFGTEKQVTDSFADRHRCHTWQRALLWGNDLPDSYWTGFYF